MAYRNILMIDDDEDDQDIFVTAVGALEVGAKCVTMSNALEALQKLSENAITPDVIFLDLNMPILNGEQFLIQIKEKPQLQDIPIIIFSTTSHVGTVKQMKDLGAIDFITKPDRYDKLVLILKPLLT